MIKTQTRNRKLPQIDKGLWKEIVFCSERLKAPLLRSRIQEINKMITESMKQMNIAMSQ